MDQHWPFLGQIYAFFSTFFDITRYNITITTTGKRRGRRRSESSSSCRYCRVYERHRRCHRPPLLITVRTGRTRRKRRRINKENNNRSINTPLLIERVKKFRYIYHVVHEQYILNITTNDTTTTRNLPRLDLSNIVPRQHIIRSTRYTVQY